MNDLHTTDKVMAERVLSGRTYNDRLLTTRVAVKVNPIQHKPKDEPCVYEISQAFIDKYPETTVKGNRIVLQSIMNW